jgi:hypothetical protein
MTRLIVAALATSLILPVASANAGYSHRHKHYRHYQAGPMWSAPVYMGRRAGPPWSRPNVCWQDLGYGRYESCDR